MRRFFYRQKLINQFNQKHRAAFVLAVNNTEFTENICYMKSDGCAGDKKTLADVFVIKSFHHNMSVCQMHFLFEQSSVQIYFPVYADSRQIQTWNYRRINIRCKRKRKCPFLFRLPSRRQKDTFRQFRQTKSANYGSVPLFPNMP